MSKVRKDWFVDMPTVWAGIGEKRRRGLRILPRQGDYFVHVTSRAVGQAFLFQDAEKRAFRTRMLAWAEFSGMTVVTHCLMDNHFHILLWVPRVDRLSHAEIRARLEGVWPKEKVEAWEEFRAGRREEEREAMDEAVRERMGDLPEFMRVLKQSFTRWYNRRADRRGTLWDSRYRSVVVENSPLALMSVAAYVDLNPVRAGLVSDPADCVWSGYGLAASGDASARRGLDLLVRCARGHQPAGARRVRVRQMNASETPWREIGGELAEERGRRAAPKDWGEVEAAYRVWLYHTGSDGSNDPRSREVRRKRRGFDPAEVLAEYERRGEVPAAKRLRRRLRSFTRGVGLGSPGFLEELMASYRSCFGPRRERAGRPIPGGWMGVESLRKVD